MPIVDDAILVLKGDTYSGTNWQYTSAGWEPSQNKTGLNVSPLWDLYNKDGVRFDDHKVYPASSFQGTKLFGYKLGSTVNDDELGLPIVYRNFNSTGDILFEINYQTDSFNYTPEALPINVACRTGYVGIINADRSITFENNYIPAVEKNITYGQKLIKVDANILNDFDLNYEFADAVAQPVIRVTVNNVKISPSNWSIVTAVSGKKKLRFTTDLVEGDLLYIEVKTNDRKASATVVYEPTQIWSNNPYNAIHGDIT